MKAISVKQPWANMIAHGKKTIETRTWATLYRGTLLIVSSKKPKITPAGYAIAVVQLINCRLMAPDDEFAACCQLYKDARAWILDDIRRIEPVPVTGKLGIYDCPLEIEQLTFLP